jgi:molybdopterin converting factor small subunit
VTQFRVLLFARYAELFGAPDVFVTLPDGACVADLMTALRTLPGGELLPAVPFVAVNHEQCDTTRRLMAGDELALLPPLAGG